MGREVAAVFAAGLRLRAAAVADVDRRGAVLPASLLDAGKWTTREPDPVSAAPFNPSFPAGFFALAALAFFACCAGFFAFADVDSPAVLVPFAVLRLAVGVEAAGFAFAAALVAVADFFFAVRLVDDACSRYPV
jgi:hypothetical protein